MTQRFAALLAGLTLIAAAHSAFAEPPSVDILVGGTPLPRYASGGRIYVEAEKNREYAIRLHNPYGVRVAVALSVDGLNTIDARHTSAAAARKWVLEPYQTVIISGWQTSRTEARRFEFTNEEHSYGEALGKTDDLGIISAVFFRERVVPSAVTQRKDAENRAGTAPSAPHPSAAGAPQQESADARGAEELAATGMGRRVDHAVTQVSLDLEDTPARAIDIRYEFHPQLVRLGVLPETPRVDRLRQRERARGFEGFSPVPPSLR